MSLAETDSMYVYEHHQTLKVWASQSGSKLSVTRYNNCWKTTWLIANTPVEVDSANCCWRCRHFNPSLGKWSSKSSRQDISEWRASTLCSKKCFSEVSFLRNHFFFFTTTWVSSVLIGASIEAGGNAPSGTAPPSGYIPPLVVSTPLTTMAPLSADSSPTHPSGGSTLTALPLLNGGQNGIGGHSAMMVERGASMAMSPDSEDDTFPLGLSNHHHQPFKQEVTEGIDNAYT